MKAYERPIIKVEEEYAEGIFLASGDKTEVNRCSKGNLNYTNNSAACRECTKWQLLGKKCPEGFVERY